MFEANLNVFLSVIELFCTLEIKSNQVDKHFLYEQNNFFSKYLQYI